MLVAMGVTAVMVGRVDVKSERLEADQQQARTLALGAIEVVRLRLENNATWRSAHTHDAWSSPMDVGGGQYRYKLVDEADGNLADDAADPVRLTVEAAVGDAVRYYSITLRDGKTLEEAIPIARSSDDAGELSALGTMFTTPDYVILGDNGTTDAIAGLRFVGLPVQPGESVVAASIQFVAYATEGGATTVSIWAHAHDDAPTFSAVLWNISSRTKTTAQADWSPGTWTAGDAGAAQRSADLSDVMQEVIDRPGWAAGNAIAFTLDAGAARTARSFDSGAADAPVLHLTYTAPGLTADYTTLRRELAD